MAQARNRKADFEAKSSPVGDAEPVYFSVTVKDAGRILLPAEARAALGVSEGETLQGIIRDGELRLSTSAAALRRTQERLAKLVPPGVSLVDELIAERRAEAAREEEETRALLATRTND